MSGLRNVGLPGQSNGTGKMGAEMKFFTLVVLPAGTDVSSATEISAAVKKLMWPYRDRTCFPLSEGESENDPDLIRKGRWDGYIEYARPQAERAGYDVGAVPSERSHVLYPLDGVTSADFGPGTRFGMPAVLTPDRQWLRYPSLKQPNYEEWVPRAASAVAPYASHHGALLFCHT